MRPGLAVFVLPLIALTIHAAATTARDVTWADLPAAVQQALTARKIDAARFPAWVKEIRTANQTRLRDGNYDHLIHYALQSTLLSSLPPIEPALSAKAFIASRRIPDDARGRLIAFAAALSKVEENAAGDTRLEHFREIAGGLRGAALESRLMREYERAMRFLYEKEFVAGRSANSADAVAALYQSRGHSSDTAIEAGYGVYVALGTLRQLEPARRIACVLIVGPGLDVAPRTSLLEEAAPQSYQPFAVADALRQLGLAAEGGLRIDAVDLNPRVASAIDRAVKTPDLRLYATTGIAENERVRFTDDYRAYLTAFGRGIGVEERVSSAGARGHVHKTIAVASGVRTSIDGHRLDIVTERAAGPLAAGYDLVIVTNVFPYLSDPELIVAIANIAALLAPGGTLIHNEPRPVLQSIAMSLGVPAIHARSVLIAASRDGRDYFDRVWIHTRR